MTNGSHPDGQQTQPKRFHFTIDVDYVRGSEQGLQLLMDCCLKKKIVPTLFVTGMFAEEYPEYIAKAARYGFELGTHG